MKVIKRDGSIVDYDSTKIVSAIEKANKEVLPEDRIIKKDIRKIITYIEKLNKKRILVEDIQDIIEIKLMEFGKYDLAKKYIVYRYNRALVRKQNTTDESILSLIKNKTIDTQFLNPNKNVKLVSTQRDLIAGEVSKDLTKRILLPENIVEAIQKGVFYFHDMDYFLQPIFNSSLIDIENILENGTVMNEKKIESPKSFQVACNIMTQIIASVASSQYGGQSICMKPFGKYLRKSKDKFILELKDVPLNETEKNKMIQERLKKEVNGGIQTIEYQVNTLMTANGLSPSLTLFLELDLNDPYLEENALIIEEIFKRRSSGMENEHGQLITPLFPRLVYVLSDCNTYQGGKYDYLTDLAYECALKRGYPYFLSSLKMKEFYNNQVFSPMGESHFLIPYKENNKDKLVGRFNQGVVTLNLPQIALLADKNDEKFFELLKERLEISIDALMRRHYSLLGTSAFVSPLHYQYGAIARLESSSKIDSLLKNGYSTLSLGYTGLKEMVYLMRNASIYDSSGKSFALKVLKFIQKKLDYYTVDTGVGFVLYATPSKEVGKHLCLIDQENFDDITLDSYTPMFGIDDQVPYEERLKIESEYQRFTKGGSISFVQGKEIEDKKKFIQFIYETNLYVSVK